jgi:hypothetical protein
MPSAVASASRPVDGVPLVAAALDGGDGTRSRSTIS